MFEIARNELMNRDLKNLNYAPVCLPLPAVYSFL